MATWAIQVGGQDGRLRSTYVKQNGRAFKRVRDAAATTYADKATADGVISGGTVANSTLYARHTEAVSVQLS